MEDQKICQSCGMPMNTEEDFGTNQDQTINEEYCNYCFKNGGFAHNITMEEMIEHNLHYLDVYNRDAEQKVTEEEAREQMREYFPTLKRWHKK